MEGFEFIGTSSHKIVALTVFDGQLIIATETGVWRKKPDADEFVELKLVYEPQTKTGD